ncbi:MAG: sulfatase-like hydrolase/transferase, partial [Planctomycetes bacterium]|nr:sulfatase-like hydrolase/transferase [Planctomycetota bacterium]
VSELLQDAGYQTALVGKWHLSKNDAKSPPRGFDYWNILPGQGKYVNPDMFEMGQRKRYEGYTTDIITDLSLKWLDKRESNRPFMLMVHHKAPHSPWQYNPKYEGMLGGEEIPEPETLWDDHSGHSKATADSSRKLKGLLKAMTSEKWATGAIDVEGLSEKEAIEKTYQKFLADYIRTVESVDESVGRIRKYLEDNGILNDTVFIYTSDQGFFLGEHGWHNKRMFYEVSVRMPFVARYPKEIKAGSTSDAMVLNIDLAETFCDYAGTVIPADMQGRSIRQVLEGNTPGNWRTSMFYRYYQGSGVPLHYGVRTHRYKLIYYTQTEEWELFDLKKDPKELKSVYADPRYKGTVKDMKEELDRLCKQNNVTEDFLNGYVPVKVPD